MRAVFDAAAVVDNSWYLSKAKCVAGEGAVILPNGTDGDIEAGTIREDLVFVEDNVGAEAGVSVPTEGEATFDNLSLCKWDGNHLLAVEGAEPTIVSSRLRLRDASARTDRLNPTPLLAYSGWSIFLVIRQALASFSGFSNVISMTSVSGPQHDIQVSVDSTGVVRVQGRVNGGSWTGRDSGAGVVALDTTCILGISSRVGQGWRAYKNQARVDTTNVGAATGVAPSQFTSWVPRIIMGGDEGSPDIVRCQFRGGLDWYADLPGFLKLQAKLNYEHRVYTPGG